MKGYVIGDEDLVLGLRLVGIEGIVVSDEKEFLEALKEVLNDGKAKIVFVSGSLLEQFRDEVESLRSRNPSSLIVEIPERAKFREEAPAAEKLLQKILKIRV